MSNFTDYTKLNLSVSYQTMAAEKLSRATAAIALTNFEWRYMTFMFFNSTVLLLGANRFLKLYNKSVLTSTGLTAPRNAEVTRQYVVFSSDNEQIACTLDWMKVYNFDNTGKFIFICESENCDETQAVQTFWYYKITNVVFLKYSGGEVIGFIYFFSGDNCAMSAPVKIDMNSCLQKTADCKLFPEKFANFKKCPLIASTFLQPPYMMNLDNGKLKGADGRLLVILAEALNATLKIMTPHRGDGWGALDENGTWIGSLGDVYYDLANISMTYCALTLNRFSQFQLSYNYNFVIVGWVCNPTELESASLKLLHPFSKFTHIAVCMSFILVIVCSILISTKLWKRLERRTGFTHKKEDSVLLYSWMICMGLATPKLPKNSILLNFVFLWIWYTFLVRTMYQASLINSLKANVYSTNVDSVEELMENDYNFGGGLALRDYYLNYPEIYDRYKGFSFVELVAMGKKIAKGEKFAMAINIEAAQSLYFTKGESYHVLSQKVVVSPTAILFKKFSPIAESVSWTLMKLVESGIADKLYREYVTARTEHHEPSDEEEPMKLEHFTGCYAIIFAGWTCSVLIFLFEIFLGYKNKYLRLGM